jgi:hypothetical protein
MFRRPPAGGRTAARGLAFLPRSWVQLAFGLLLGLVLGVGSGLWATAQEVPARQQLIPNPQQFRALEQPSSALSALRAEQLAAEANAAIQAQNYDRAIELLQQVFNAYNQRSNYHQDLSRAFAGIQTASPKSSGSWPALPPRLGIRPPTTWPWSIGLPGALRRPWAG